MSQQQPFGVIGSGSFGTAIANILAENGPVLLYTRKPQVVSNIMQKGVNKGQQMHPNVRPTLQLEEVCTSCDLIFPVVSSKGFRDMMKNAAPYLKPRHILIHCTKGLNLALPNGQAFERKQPLKRDYIRSMSQIIREESVVLRIGCLAGPNLARELAEGQIAATVIASRFVEVIEKGKAALKSHRFRVYGSHDIRGVELAGVLKNIMAIASGILAGLGLGENAKAMLIARGLGEMVKIGKVLGTNARSFLGVAGIGDLVATCSSPSSRNYTVGYRLAKGEKLEQIIEDMNEVAEGVNTVQLAKGIALQYNLELPIVETLFEVLYEGTTIPKAMSRLMEHKLDVDADFWLDR